MLRPHAVIIALAAAHAALFGLAWPPAGLWPLAAVAVIPLAALALLAPSARVAAAVVFLVQLAAWLLIERWVADVTAVGYPLMCVYLAAYPVVFVALLRFVHRNAPRWPMTLLVPLLWVGLEALRGRVLFSGYPWFLAAHPLVEWPVAVQSADLLGSYFVSFLAVMPAGVAIDAWRLRRGEAPRRAVVAGAVATAGVWAAALGYGAWRLAGTPRGGGPLVLAVQTNLPQDNKMAWSPQQQAADFEAFVELTVTAFEQSAAGGRRPELIVWPETMLPGFGLEPAAIRTIVEGGFWPGDTFSAGIAELSRRLDTPLLVGSLSYIGLATEPVDGGLKWRWAEHYNSAYLVTGDPPYQRYDKVFLTPFGETMPYISAWPWLEGRMLAVGARGMSFDLDAAEAPRLLELPRPDGPPVVLGTPICFEDTVPAVCRRMIYAGGAKRGDALVNLSNDGWLGASVGGRIRHAQIARFRCIENRVPCVRAVNTGVSVAVNAAGRIIGSAGPGPYGTARAPGWLLAELPLDSRSTLYGRVGDAWALCCLLGAAGAAAHAAVARRRAKGPEA